MKTLLCFAIFVLTAQLGYAQSSGIDLSKDPAKPPLNPKKSNAVLLQETGRINPGAAAEPNLADQYNNKDINTDGTYRKALPAGTGTTDGQMMNATQHQGNIGNLKTSSSTYYDNSGKIHSTGTTIKIGK